MQREPAAGVACVDVAVLFCSHSVCWWQLFLQLNLPMVVAALVLPFRLCFRRAGDAGVSVGRCPVFLRTPDVHEWGASTLVLC